MPAMFINREAGDPVEAERTYNTNFAERAGQPGRGEDWGVPLVVLQHIRGYKSDGHVTIDMFEDADTMETLAYSPQDLAEHLRTVTLGTGHRSREQDRQKGNRVFLRVHKVVPPLRAIATEQGGARRPRF